MHGCEAGGRFLPDPPKNGAHLLALFEKGPTATASFALLRSLCVSVVKGFTWSAQPENSRIPRQRSCRNVGDTKWGIWGQGRSPVFLSAQWRKQLSASRLSPLSSHARCVHYH
jgi:hypothetical protein